MKKTITFLAMLLFTSASVFGQNVGIGTSTPATHNNLHVHSDIGFDASIGITNAVTTNAIQRGIRLRMLNSDFNIINYETSGKIKLSTNFNTRITIDALGKVGINTLSPNHALHVTALNKYGIYSTATVNGSDTIAGVYGMALSPTPVPFSAGVRGESNSTNFNGIGVLGIHNGSGWGVAGFVKELGVASYGAGVYGSAGSSLSGLGEGGYGVYGVNNNTNGVAGFFQNNSPSLNSYALKTEGKLKFNSIGEANGKVLTSDAVGNATWQVLPAGASAWTVSGNNISNSNSGSVGIGTNVIDNFTKLQVLINSGDEGFIKFQTTETDKGVGLVFKNPNGQWYMGQNIGNYPDARFNIYYTTTVGGASQLLTLTKEGNLGIGDYTGLGIAPTERLEIKNGFMKVSGANKTAFTITATASNSSNHILNLSYANQASTDILIVTHNFSPPGGPSAYHNYNVGVYWDGNNWTIYNENTTIPILGISFNVLVIKQ